MKRMCGTCKYASKEVGQTDEYLLCVIHPPTVIGTHGSPVSRFPTVRTSSFCGSYRPKTPDNLASIIADALEDKGEYRSADFVRREFDGVKEET